MNKGVSRSDAVSLGVERQGCLREELSPVVQTQVTAGPPFGASGQGRGFLQVDPRCRHVTGTDDVRCLDKHLSLLHHRGVGLFGSVSPPEEPPASPRPSIPCWFGHGLLARAHAGSHMCSCAICSLGTRLADHQREGRTEALPWSSGGGGAESRSCQGPGSCPAGTGMGLAWVA